MDGAGNVEFDAAHRDASATGDDVIEFGRGRLPRWAVALGVVLGVAAVILGLVVVRSPGGPRAVVTERGPVPTPAPAPGTGLGARLPLPNEASLDVVVAGSSTWVLQPDYLSVIVAGARRSVSVSGAGLSAADAAGALLLDASVGRLWLVVTGVSPCHLIEYDAASLQRLRDVSWPPSVSSAAVLGGHVYLATGSGVADLAPGAAAPQLIADSGPGAGGDVVIATDPSRARLLVIEPGYPDYPSLIRQYRASTGMSPTAVPLPFQAWSLVVADGTIWVYGIGTPTARYIGSTRRRCTRSRTARLSPMPTRTRVSWPADHGSSG